MNLIEVFLETLLDTALGFAWLEGVLTCLFSHHVLLVQLLLLNLWEALFWKPFWKLQAGNIRVRLLLTVINQFSPTLLLARLFFKGVRANRRRAFKSRMIQNLGGILGGKIKQSDEFTLWWWTVILQTSMTSEWDQAHLPRISLWVLWLVWLHQSSSFFGVGGSLFSSLLCLIPRLRHLHVQPDTLACSLAWSHSDVIVVCKITVNHHTVSSLDCLISSQFPHFDIC